MLHDPDHFFIIKPCLNSYQIKPATMKKIVLFLLVITSLTAKAQTKMLEKVTQKGSEIVIPYEKYVLPNGLTVIVHEDHSDPVVHVDVTYHVGSAR